MSWLGLDWFDIALHALAAGIVVGAAALLGEPVITAVMAIANSHFWFARELSQHKWKFGGTQSQVEWLVPCIVGYSIAVLDVLEVAGV
jgi:hypothetical protein